MAEWLGNGLQNRVQQFDSAWYLPLNPAPGGIRCLRRPQANTHCYEYRETKKR